MIDARAMREAFVAETGERPRLFVAPGRVNLIGEHTDYNEGFVLPLAIDRATTVAAVGDEGRRITCHSATEGRGSTIDLDRRGDPKTGHWGDYVEGMARTLDRHFEGRLTGARLRIDGDVPVGAGLSSSAALEVAVGLALTALSGGRIDPSDLARLAQRSEHEWVGTRCGIMDPLVSASGRAGHAVLIDCRTLERRWVPIDPAVARVVICNTRVKHTLASSGYNDRRRECEQGVTGLREHLPDIRSLRDVTAAAFERHAWTLPETVRRRCRHVITENARTREAAEALADGELDRVGALMRESHRSLRDDYEVSCRELDHDVALASAVDGVWGSRMTGGGFGGCSVHLVEPAATEGLTHTLLEGHRRQFGIEPDVFVAVPCDGARELT